MRIFSAALLLFFTPTLEALLPHWRAQSDTPVVISSGPSGALTQQILAGAPFGLFLSADADYPRALHAKAKGAKPVVYARGQLIAACTFATGNADCALVASSFQTLAPDLHWYPLDHAPVLTQAASVLDNTGAAPEFLRFLLSDTTQHLIQQNGYLAATP